MNKSLFKHPSRPYVALVLVLLALPSWLAAQEHCEGDSSGAEQLPGIVSIGGAITETIYALGQGERILATDTTSYYPEAAQQLPKVGYQRALSVEGILSYQPGLLIVSDQAGPPRVVQQLMNSGVKIHTLATASSVEEVLDNIRALGRLLCAEQESQALTLALQQAQSGLPAFRHSDARRVLFILQHGGGAPMVAGTGTSADSIISLAGALNAVDSFEGYKPLTPEALVNYQPELILTTKRGLQQAGGLNALLDLPGVALTPAGQRKAVVAMDALLLLGFGPRTIEAAQMLAQELYPET